MIAAPSGNIWEEVCPPAARYLSDEHRRILEEESGILPEIVDGRGYHTLEAGQVLKLVQLEILSPAATRATGWMGIPIIRPDGMKHGEIVRLFGTAAKMKYLWPTGQRLAFDVHPDHLEAMLDTTVDIVITEGVKKGDAILSQALREGRRLVVVSVNGCEGWRVKLGENRVASPDFLDIAWENRHTYVVSDSDYRTNDDVARGWSGCAVYVGSKTGPHRTNLVVVPPLGTDKQGADDFLASGHTLGDLLEHAQTPRHAALDADEDRVPLRLKGGLQLMREAGVKIPYLVSPLLPEQSVTLLAGHSGTYKTWAALSLALDGAFGLPWMGHPLLAPDLGPFSTLYVNKEMSGIIMGHRLRLMAQDERYSVLPDYERVIDERIIFVDEPSLDINLPAQRERLEDAIVATGAKIVVLDSLSMSWHGDENSSTEVGVLYTSLREISSRTGVAWVIVHHLLKPSSTHLKRSDPKTAAIRGSGQLSQQADVAIMLSHHMPGQGDDAGGPPGERLIEMAHAKARTDVEVPSWVSRFSNNDGLFVGFSHLCSLADAKARAYAKSPEDGDKLGEWILEEIATMPAMASKSSGIRFRALAVLLQQAWKVPDKTPPSESTIRRQIQQLAEKGRLSCVEESRKHGDLYRLVESEDEDDGPDTGTTGPAALAEPTPPPVPRARRGAQENGPAPHRGRAVRTGAGTARPAPGRT